MFSHGEVVHHLVRRGAEVVVQQSSNGDQAHYDLERDFPLWGKIALALTIVLGCTFVASIRYTLWGVVPTLASVEEDHQTTYIVRDEKTDLKEPDALTEESIDTDILVIKQKPVTRKIKSTIRHITSRGGWRARWRGLSLFIVYSFLHSIVFKLMLGLVSMPLMLLTSGPGYYRSFGPHVVGRILASALSSALLARLSMTWTHIVISEPSAKPWYRRIPDRAAFKNVVGATFIADLATSLPLVLAGACAWAFKLHEYPSNMMDGDRVQIPATQVLMVLLIGLTTFVGITIPALVSAARVQASMLPEEDETIVNFDRTFKGKVVPRILGGTGALTFKEAWMTFNRPARLRMLKLLVKNVMIEISLHIFFGLLITSEVVLAIGPENIRKMIEEHRRNSSGQVVVD